MAKQVVVCSPELWLEVDTLIGDSIMNDWDCNVEWVCTKTLKRFGYFPKADKYWVEIANKQWLDGSGLGLWVLRLPRFRWGVRKNRLSGLFFEDLEVLIDKLLSKKDGPHRIYFRLRYEA